MAIEYRLNKGFASRHFVIFCYIKPSERSLSSRSPALIAFRPSTCWSSIRCVGSPCVQGRGCCAGNLKVLRTAAAGVRFSDHVLFLAQHPEFLFLFSHPKFPTHGMISQTSARLSRVIAVPPVTVGICIQIINPRQHLEA